MAIPKPTLIFRIIHRKNLEILLEEGKLFAPNYSTNPNYISIGETNLIRQRGDKAIIISPFGTMKDYISFYFGVRSPMLYCIWNGFDVQQRPQHDIIYLISSIEKLEELKVKYVFTDGHSFAGYTQFFNDPKNLNQIDWRTIRSRNWANTDDDPDKKRRKEAECLVYREVSVDAIFEIVVYNQAAYDYILNVLNEKNKNIPVALRRDWYY